jgi:hypothetical protein
MNRKIVIRGIPVVAADVFLFASLLFYPASRAFLLDAVGFVEVALIFLFFTARQVVSDKKADY